MRSVNIARNRPAPSIRFRNRRSGRGEMTGFLFILPSLAGCLLFVMVPFADAIRRSMTTTLTGEFVGLKFYREIFQNASFRQACLNTGRFMALCVPALVVFSLFLAMMLSKRVYGRGALRAAFLLPMAVPVASIALLWKALFHESGLANAFISSLGLTPIDWMKTDWSLFCLILSYLWKNAGYNMVLFLTGLNGISAALYEAADVDGAGPWRKFRSITLPCLKPTLFTVMVLALLNAFKAYREAWLVAGNYPQGSIYLIQHTLNNWFSGLEIEKLSAAATVTALVILVLVALLNRAWQVEVEAQ
mgnify:CR=1 FL=1